MRRRLTAEEIYAVVAVADRDLAKGLAASDVVLPKVLGNRGVRGFLGAE